MIQREAQTTAGMPVAAAMFTASVGALGAKGDERKKTVFQIKKGIQDTLNSKEAYEESRDSWFRIFRHRNQAER